MNINPPDNTKTLLLIAILTAPLSVLPAPQATPQPEQLPTIEAKPDLGLYSATSVAALDAAGSTALLSTANGTATAPPLIISAEGWSQTVLDEIDEDMRIMGRLLADQTAGLRSTAWASGIPLIQYTRQSKPRDQFIAGAGALFFLNVDFPLAGREVAKQPVVETPKDTAWERARQRIYGGNRSAFSQTPSAQAGNEGFLPPKAYRAEQVDRLLDTIVEALASATNIRHLDESETVWVVISGPATASPSQAAIPVIPQGDFHPTPRPYRLPYQTATSNPGKPQTTLTIAADKKDIDRLAEGNMTPTEFLANLKSQAR